MEKQLRLSKEEFWDALTLSREVDENGSVRWFNADGLLHRENCPAVTYTDGTKYWVLNGEIHRVDGPAIIYGDGTKRWYLNGVEVDAF